MVSSLDGYIARKDNNISWFETTDNYENGVSISEQDQEKFLKAIDCYVMGSRTYEQAFELAKSYGWAYGDVPTIVLTHRELPIDRPNIETYSGDLNKLVADRLAPNHKNIWVVGGANLVRDFFRLNLVDEIRHSILPIILGDGTPFYDRIGLEQALHLKNVIAYKSGMVELCYAISK